MSLNILTHFVILDLFRNLKTFTKYCCYFTSRTLSGESTNLICTGPKRNVTSLNILKHFVILDLFCNLKTFTKYCCYFTSRTLSGESTNLAASVTKYPTGVWPSGVTQT
jgi:hypothetical protein